MPALSFSQDEMKTIVSEITKQLIPVLTEKLKQSDKQNDLPPLLTRRQFMELVDISHTKCNELFNRDDFPVVRELGHPRVPTKLFFEWVEKSATNHAEINLQYPYKAI